MGVGGRGARSSVGGAGGLGSDVAGVSWNAFIEDLAPIIEDLTPVTGDLTPVIEDSKAPKQ